MTRKKGHVGRRNKRKKADESTDHSILEPPPEPETPTAKRPRAAGRDGLRPPPEKADNFTAGNRIISMSSFFEFLSRACRCSVPGCDGAFSLHSCGKNGFQGFLYVQCVKCSTTFDFVTSPKSGGSKAAEINERSVIAARLAGIGHAALVLFCLTMDMDEPVAWSSWLAIQDRLTTTAEQTMQESFRRERLQIRQSVDADDDTVVGEVGTFDGTWATRFGNRSKIGASALMTTGGKIISVAYRVNRCQKCQAQELLLDDKEFSDWRDAHIANDECVKNWDLSAPAMEASMAVENVQRVLDEAKIMIDTIVMDGDSASLAALNRRFAGMFGPHFAIIKFEDANHVTKALYELLHKMLKAHNATLEKSKKRLSLNPRLVERLTSLAGQAVRKHVSEDIETRKKYVLAVAYHKAGRHEYCPTEDAGFCKMQQASGHVTSYPISEDLFVNVVKPVFDKFAANRRLQVVTRFGTQQNESWHSELWRIISKNSNHGGSEFRFGLFLAVCLHNNGYGATVEEIFARMKIPLQYSSFSRLDARKSYFSSLHNSQEYKERRHYNKRTVKDRLQGGSNLVDGRLSYRSGGFFADNETENFSLTFFPDLVLPVDRPSNRFDISQVSTALLSRLRLTCEQAQALERETRGQAKCERWHCERRGRLTASNAKLVLSRVKSGKEVTPNFLHRVFGSKNLSRLAACKAGIAAEPMIVERYLKANPHVSVGEVGFIVNHSIPFAGASPDRVVRDEITGEYGVLEVKLAYALMKKGVSVSAALAHSALLPKGFCLKRCRDGSIVIKKSHQYYCQVIMQLGISGLSFCDFVISAQTDGEVPFVVRVEWNNETSDEWSTYVQKLGAFYVQHSASILSVLSARS